MTPRLPSCERERPGAPPATSILESVPEPEPRPAGAAALGGASRGGSDPPDPQEQRLIAGAHRIPAVSPGPRATRVIPESELSRSRELGMCPGVALSAAGADSVPPDRARGFHDSDSGSLRPAGGSRGFRAGEAAGRSDSDKQRLDSGRHCCPSPDPVPSCGRPGPRSLVRGCREVGRPGAGRPPGGGPGGQSRSAAGAPPPPPPPPGRLGLLQAMLLLGAGRGPISATPSPSPSPRGGGPPVAAWPTDAGAHAGLPPGQSSPCRPTAAAPAARGRVAYLGGSASGESSGISGGGGEGCDTYDGGGGGGGGGDDGDSTLLQRLGGQWPPRILPRGALLLLPAAPLGGTGPTGRCPC